MNKELKKYVPIILLIFILYYAIGWWFVFTKDKPNYIQYIGAVTIFGGIAALFFYLKQKSKR